MIERDRAQLTTYLIRAQDALKLALEVAERTGQTDFAQDLRARRRKLGEDISRINGGPLLTMQELLRS